MEKKKKETKLQELERRIAELERNITVFIQQPYPSAVPFSNQIPQCFSKCGVCGAIYVGYHYCNGIAIREDRKQIWGI